MGAGDPPEGPLERLRALDGLTAEVEGRQAALECDLSALDGTADADALRAALAEFDAVWGALEPEERARVLALVLDEVVVDGQSGEAELRFRGGR